MGSSRLLVLSLVLITLASTPWITVPGSSVFATTYGILIPIKARGSGPLYRIQENDKWGYMDREGNIVIPPRFESAADFFEHKAAVSFGGRTGYIDEVGKWQVEPKFLHGGRFKGGVAVAASPNAQG